MKVILNDFVPHLGAPGDQVKVAPGYARNYLIPKKLAVEATPAAVSLFENNLKQRARKLSRFFSEAEAQKKSVEAVEKLVFVRKAGEEGKLFGSVTSADIEGALKEKGFAIEKKQIELKQPIKTISEQSVTIKLFKGVSATLTIMVEAEETEAPKDEEHEAEAPEEEADEPNAGADEEGEDALA